ncbi:MAG: tetratricopeptide repeat protein [Rubrivivax sp.]|nr:tetratricopeptide repeat protein [Rubrivivax sp.]
MSVINKVLRDLDARGATPNLPPLAPGEQPPPATGKKAAGRPLGTRLALIVGCGGALIGLAAFGDLGPLTGTRAAPAVAHAAPASGEPPAPAAAAGPGHAPAPQSGDAPAAPASEAGAPQVPAATTPTTPTTATTPITPPPPTAPAGPAAPATAAAPTAAPSHPATPTPARAAAQPSARSAAPAEPRPPTLPAATLGRASLPPTPPRVDKRLHAPDAAQQQARLYRQAVDAAQAGHRASAVSTARELLALNPRHEAARQLAAHLEAEAGATDRAVALLREGLAQDASQTSLALTLAHVLASEGLADEALAVLEAHAVPGPEAAGLRAGVLARRGDYAAALPAYEAAARAQPLNPMWWLGLGVALESLGEPARARLAFAKAHTIGLPQPELADYVQQRLRALE